MGGLVKHADRFKAGGVNIFTQDKDGTKHLKGFQEIIEAVGQSKLAKDPQRLVRAFGTKEAYQAYLQLVKVKGAWSDLASSTAHADDLAKDYATYQQSAAGQIELGWNAVKNSVAQTFTPEVIGGFVLALKDALKFIQDMIIGLKGIGEELDHLTGGKESKVGRMEGDDALEKALKAGYRSPRSARSLDSSRSGTSRRSPASTTLSSSTRQRRGGADRLLRSRRLTSSGSAPRQRCSSGRRPPTPTRETPHARISRLSSGSTWTRARPICAARWTTARGSPGDERRLVQRALSGQLRRGRVRLPFDVGLDGAGGREAQLPASRRR